MKEYCFVWVEFPFDENVKGLKYWYLCADESVREGDFVVAPLGRHNRTQRGIVHRVTFAPEYEAPFPLYLIKSVEHVLREKKE